MRPFVGFDEMGAYLNSVERQMNQGESATVMMVSSQPATQRDLDQFAYDVTAMGFHLAGPIMQSPANGGCSLSVPLIKGSPIFQMLLPLVPLIFVGGLLGYWIISGKATEFMKGAVIPLLLVAGGITIIIVFMLRKPAEAVAVGYMKQKTLGM